MQNCRCNNQAIHRHTQGKYLVRNDSLHILGLNGTLSGSPTASHCIHHGRASVHPHFLLGYILKQKVLFTGHFTQTVQYVWTLPSSAVEADRSVVEVFAGGQRAENEADHTRPQRETDVPLLQNGFNASWSMSYHFGCLQLPEALLPFELPGGRTSGQPPGLRSQEAGGL